MGDGLKSCRPKLRARWTLEEDDRLKTAVSQAPAPNGIPAWAAVASIFNAGAEQSPFSVERTGRQCRQRYTQYHPGDRVLDGWTSGEDNRLLELVEHNGRKWAAMRSEFPGRSAQDIKNRFHTHLKKGCSVGVIENGNRLFKNVIGSEDDGEWMICVEAGVVTEDVESIWDIYGLGVD